MLLYYPLNSRRESAKSLGRHDVSSGAQACFHPERPESAAASEWSRSAAVAGTLRSCPHDQTFVREVEILFLGPGLPRTA
jgi:hypothetical protein